MRKKYSAPSPALVISLIALFVALSGTGYAASKLNGKNIRSGTVGGKALKNRTVTGGKLANNTVTGRQVRESTLGSVPSAVTATRAGSATSAASAATAGRAETAGSAAPSGAAGGDLAGTYPNPTLSAGAVGASDLADGVVRAGKLGTITRRQATASIPANTFDNASAQCQSGEKVLWGGNDGDPGMYVVASRADGTSGWDVFVSNTTASAKSLTAYAYCLAP